MKKGLTIENKLFSFNYFIPDEIVKNNEISIFEYFLFSWDKITEMTQKRYYGTSVLDPNGDMWVLGGTANSSNADSTEVYQYKPRPRSGRWRKGYPLPTALRDTGIESQCNVRINSSHVFMAGGMYLFIIQYRTRGPPHKQFPLMMLLLLHKWRNS